MQPNENLTFLHLVLFTAAMLAIYGWGLYTLEAQLAREAGTIVAGREE